MRTKRLSRHAAATMRSASVRSISDFGESSASRLALNSSYASWLSPGMTVVLPVSPWITPFRRVLVVSFGPVARRFGAEGSQHASSRRSRIQGSWR